MPSGGPGRRARPSDESRAIGFCQILRGARSEEQHGPGANRSRPALSSPDSPPRPCTRPAFRDGGHKPSVARSSTTLNCPVGSDTMSSRALPTAWCRGGATGVEANHGRVVRASQRGLVHSARRSQDPPRASPVPQKQSQRRPTSRCRPRPEPLPCPRQRRAAPGSARVEEAANSTRPPLVRPTSRHRPPCRSTNDESSSKRSAGSTERRSGRCSASLVAGCRALEHADWLRLAVGRGQLARR